MSVAQLDRVTASDAVGCGFDPRRAHHILERKIDTRDLRSFNCQKHKTTFCEYNKKSANYFAVFFVIKLNFLLHRFEKHFVGNQSYKFAVSRLFVVVINPYAEQRIYVFDFAAIPCNFYCMTDCAFHFRRTCVEFFGDFGIQLFGYAVYNVGIVDGELNGFAQKLIALLCAGIPTVIKIFVIFSSSERFLI